MVLPPPSLEVLRHYGEFRPVVDLNKFIALVDALCAKGDTGGQGWPRAFALAAVVEWLRFMVSCPRLFLGVIPAGRCSLTSAGRVLLCCVT